MDQQLPAVQACRETAGAEEPWNSQWVDCSYALLKLQVYLTHAGSRLVPPVDTL